MTPYYSKGGITIYCGECSQAMAQVLQDESIDLTVTSPPYDNLREYNGYRFEFEPIAQELWRVTGQGGVVVWVVADETKNGSESGTSFRQALGFMEIGFRLHDTMIYKAAGVGAKGSNLSYWQAFEYMFILSKGRPDTINLIRDKQNTNADLKHGNSGLKHNRLGNRTATGYKTQKLGARENVWVYRVGNTSGGDLTDHPAPFPEALARDHIISWSNPGDLVLDPMVGSGTTLKMCQALGRRGIGIDVSEEYCQIAVDRLRQPSFFSIPDEPVKVEGKQLGLFGES